MLGVYSIVYGRSVRVCVCVCDIHLFQFRLWTLENFLFGPWSFRATRTKGIFSGEATSLESFEMKSSTDRFFQSLGHNVKPLISLKLWAKQIKKKMRKQKERKINTDVQKWAT